MIVNRPYLVAVVDQPTGALLMLGHIEEPTP
jgi:serine protease inhibitor